MTLEHNVLFVGWMLTQMYLIISGKVDPQVQNF